jgi:flavin reductase (DIM6/NTAB) family NADH-FMN oxidoreductase RutF
VVAGRDHTFFVGEVLSVELGRAAAPLVRHEGRYRSL